MKAVIFDMDGVICHTNPTHTFAFKEFFAKRNIFPSDVEFSKHMFGKSNAYILKHFMGREIVGQEFLELEFEKEALFRKLYADKIAEIDGFMAFLDSLKTNGIKTGVATSAPYANLELIMNGLGFEKMMESIMASENVTKHKPDPEVYLKSALNMGVNPDQSIVFEDSFSGITAGLNARMQVVGVLSSHTKDELPPCVAYISDYKNLDFNSLIEMIA